VTTSLTIGSEVIDRVGLRKAAEFQARVTTFECVECGTAGDARLEPAVVVLRTSPGLSHLGVAHQRCADSEVREYGQGDLVLSDEVDLIPRAIGLPSPHGIRPALLLACEEEITFSDGDGRSYDPYMKQLLTEGLHQLPSLDKAAPPSLGWQIRIGPGMALRVDSRERPYLSDGEVYVPPVWMQLMAPVGAVTLLIARLSREDIYAVQPPFRAYASALKNRHMVGGQVSVQGVS